MMWTNLILALAVILILPVYRHMYRTHQFVQTAKSTGVWTQIPRYIPAHADYIDVLQQQAKLLLLKLKTQDATITIDASDPLPIYTFLHRMNKMPALQIESFTMQRQKGRVLAIVILGKNAVRDRGSSNMRESGSSIQGFPPVEDNKPRFFYVNAAAEVDGKKQIWVNGKSYGPSCPWPLYHTFDRQTGTVKKGDLRPRLSLTSGT